MRSRRLGVVVLALFAAFVQRPALDAQGNRRAAVDGEILVKYRQGSSERVLERARTRAHAQLKRRHRLARGRADEAILEVLNVPAGTVAAAIAALRNDPNVEHAEPNIVYRPSVTPNDPYFEQLWGLQNTGQPIGGASGVADADVDAVEAWAHGIGSPQVYVAVLDQGIDAAHEDLGADPYGPIWTNPYDWRDGFDNDGNGYVDDTHGFDFAFNDNTIYDGSPTAAWMDAHGTHVAGTIGARPNNGVGVAGVNWDVRIIPVKFMGPDGGTTDAAVRGIDYIIDLKTRHGLNIVAINASWGSQGYSQILLEAIARAAREDILFIAAAGNGGPDDIGDDNDQMPEYPASYDPSALAGWDSVISVAATGPWDDLPGFSNFGERSVDLGAPGVSVLSTAPQNRYSYSNGTSMATAHVTGAAALVSAATGLTGSALRARLLASVDRRASLQGRTTTGGRLTIAAAFTQSTTPSTPPALPSPWQSTDIGAVGTSGGAAASAGTFTMSGAGADVWDTADAFRYTYRNLTGDGSITARVVSVQYVHAWTKAGVMIRASLSPGAAHAFMLVSPGKGAAFQRRPADGAASLHTAGSWTAAPRWVRVTRSGSTVQAFESGDGLSWTLVGSSTIALGTTAHVGLAVSSHVWGTAAEARFDNVSVASASTAWANGDIGAVGLAGSATVSPSSMTVRGSGADIWGTSDQFHYVYQPLTGDGSIVARVTDIQNSHVWVKAGVMIRDTLAPDSAQAMMLVTPGGTKGLAFQRRVTAGGLSASTSGGAGTAPSWVRLVRTGQTITASRSSDGLTWTTVGSDTFVMRQSVYVGIAVTSHDNGVLATATFDNISISR